VKILEREIGPGRPAYVVAELSANHLQDFDRAVRLVHEAHAAGADAVKLQTYTADTLTIRSDQPYFKIQGTIWEGRTLHDLYAEACTPWEWTQPLGRLAAELGMHCFSSPFDETAVDFLQSLDSPAYKIASFELVDLPLIERVANTGKPMIMSTGMATLTEIERAVRAARGAGNRELTLLKCTSAYPSDPADMNLRTIPHLAQAFGVPVGLSDHTPGSAVPVAAVALGACLIEKHLTLDRGEGGPDAAFSLQPEEFKAMVDAVRVTEAALGAVSYQLTEKERESRVFRRSLFVVKPVKAGEPFTAENVRSIRPAHGLEPRHWKTVLAGRAACDLEPGTPLEWRHFRDR